MNQRIRIHRGWMVLFGCCCMVGGSMGVVMNTAGLFFSAVGSDLGFAAGEISLYRTISGVSSCLLLPFVGRMLYRWDTRVTLTISGVVLAGCAALMGTFSALWQWYAAAAVQGIASAMLLTASAPIILANWFREKLGLAIGISAAFSGLMGTVGNMGFAAVINAWGWRVGYYSTAAVSLLMIVPATLFIIRLKPSMVGCTPYGVKEQTPAMPNPGVPLSPARRMAVIVLLVAGVCAMQFCTGFSPQLVNFAVSVGYPLSMGAMLVSWSMVTNAVGKVAMGEINDRLGLKGACLGGFLFAAPGFLLLLSANTGVMQLGSAFYGVAMSLAVVTPPLLTRKFFSDADYPKVFSFVMMLSTLGSSFAPAVFGWMYDGAGSYVSVLFLGVTLSVLYLVCCAGLYTILKRVRQECRAVTGGNDHA